MSWGGSEKNCRFQLDRLIISKTSFVVVWSCPMDLRTSVNGNGWPHLLDGFILHEYNIAQENMTELLVPWNHREGLTARDNSGGTSLNYRPISKTMTDCGMGGNWMKHFLWILILINHILFINELLKICQFVIYNEWDKKIIPKRTSYGLHLMFTMRDIQAFRNNFLCQFWTSV